MVAIFAVEGSFYWEVFGAIAIGLVGDFGRPL
jgi:hypothetical protein